MRLGWGGDAITGSPELTKTVIQSVSTQKGAWEERGGDSELTNAKKKSPNLPTSSTDDQPKEPRLPASYAQTHVMKLGF
jgi:hypothetical protein